MRLYWRIKSTPDGLSWNRQIRLVEGEMARVRPWLIPLVITVAIFCPLVGGFVGDRFVSDVLGAESTWPLLMGIVVGMIAPAIIIAVIGRLLLIYFLRLRLRMAREDDELRRRSTH
jgi:hypothetical protein